VFRVCFSKPTTFKNGGSSSTTPTASTTALSFHFKPTNAALSASLAEYKYIMSSVKTPTRKSSKVVDLVSQFFISSNFRCHFPLKCTSYYTFFFAIF